MKNVNPRPWRLFASATALFLLAIVPATVSSASTDAFDTDKLVQVVPQDSTHFTVMLPTDAIAFEWERTPEGIVVRYSSPVIGTGRVLYPTIGDPVILESQGAAAPAGCTWWLCSAYRATARAAIRAIFGCWPACPVNCCWLPCQFSYGCFLATCACGAS